MKNKHNEGFTLVELLVSMAILAAIVLPTCNSLALGFQLNAKAEQMMQARLAVSSAVETLMATGITDDFLDSLTKEPDENGKAYYRSDLYDDLYFELEYETTYYTVKVKTQKDQEPVVTAVRNLASKTLEEVLNEKTQ